MASVSRQIVLSLRDRINGQLLLFGFILAVVLFFVLYPVLLILINSFQIASPGEEPIFGLEGWRLATTEPGIRSSLYNTFVLLLVRQLISFPIAILLAWLIARTDVPLRGWLELTFWVSFFLPTLSVTLGWILLLDPEYGLLNELWTKTFHTSKGPFNIYSFSGIVWAHLVANGISVKVMLLTPAFRNMNASLEEASRLCGATTFGTLFRIVIPMMTPAVVVVFLLSTIRGMQTFEIEMILGTPIGIDVYSTKIYGLIYQDPPAFAPATALSTITLLIILPFIIMQRWLITRRQYTTVEGRSQVHAIRLGLWKYPAFVFIVAISVVLTVLPLVFLLMATFMKLFGFFRIPNPWTLANWQRVFDDPVFLISLKNTILMGLGAAFLSVLLFSLIAYIVVRSKLSGRAILDFVSWLPIALPGILLGIGLLWLFLDNAVFRPIYGTVTLLVIATVIGTMPLGTQIIKSNMIQIGAELEEASRVVGASWWYTYRTIVLPIMTPVLVLVGLTSFISAARDISHVALLATHRSRTLALLQLDFMVAGQYEGAAVVSTLVVGLSTGLALITCFFGLRLKSGEG
jgi:iron(III) transport system permease protein